MKLFNYIAVLMFSLWFWGCAQTTVTKPTMPVEETKQSEPAASPASTKSAESGKQESGQKSEAGGASSAASSETLKKESGQPAAAGSQSSPTQKKSDSGQPASRASAGESAEARLAKAQENLRISEQTEKRIAADLDQLKKSGNASDEAIRDYENYLESVRAMTAENRNMVKQMQAAYANKSAGQTGPDVPASNEMQRMANPDIPEEQTMDEVAALDRELDASLARFDDMLLKEMEKIQAGSSDKLQELAEKAAEAAKRLREKGLDIDTSGSKSAKDDEKASEAESESGREKPSAEGKSGMETASKDGARKGGEGPSSTDQHRKEYEDDDIVARQLREAAENETDPELKARLWKEYEEYKKSK